MRAPKSGSADVVLQRRCKGVGALFREEGGQTLLGALRGSREEFIRDEVLSVRRTQLVAASSKAGSEVLEVSGKLATLL